jgi:hypothetical protein
MQALTFVDAFHWLFVWLPLHIWRTIVHRLYLIIFLTVAVCGALVVKSRLQKMQKGAIQLPGDGREPEGHGQSGERVSGSEDSV